MIQGEIERGISLLSSIHRVEQGKKSCQNTAAVLVQNGTCVKGMMERMTRSSNIMTSVDKGN